MTAPKQALILKALFDKVVAIPTLSTLVGGRIHNHLPQGAPSPYVRVRWADPEDWSTKTSIGFLGNATIDVWSDQHGDKQMLELTDLIMGGLHNAPLTVAGAQIVMMQHLRSTFIPEPDGVSRHGVLTFQIIATS